MKKLFTSHMNFISTVELDNVICEWCARPSTGGFYSKDGNRLLDKQIQNITLNIQTDIRTHTEKVTAILIITNYS